MPTELVLPPVMPPDEAAPVLDEAVWLWEVPSLPVLTYPPEPPLPAPPVAVPPLAVAGPDVATPVWTTVALWIDACTFAFRASLLNPMCRQRVRRKHEPNCEHSKCEQSA